MDDARIYTNLARLIALKQYAMKIRLSASYRPAGMLSGQHASRLRGSGLNFEELRQYQDGDNIRQIDSRTSARLGKPYVRIYSEETDRPVSIVVDQRLSMFFGSVDKTKSVVAAEVAALFAWMVHSAGDRVGGLVIADKIHQISTKRTSRGVLQLLETIVTANNQLSLDPVKASNTPQTSIFSQVKPWLSSLNNQSVVILITDIEGLAEDDINELEVIHHKANILLFIVQDPLEVDISQAHGLSVSQGQQQINIQANTDNQDKFDQLYKAKLQRLEQALVASTLPIGLVNTIDPVDVQIATLLQGYK
ncbi:DUF58 domain-containing protein [Moritella marina]|uniref:DUF58 domain-containing protein n=1 Tax=Moritella marina TaxID=90736 RepID=UPI003703ABAA